MASESSIGPGDLELVEQAVRRISGTRNYADRADMISDGTLALLEAVRVWEERPEARTTSRVLFLRRVVRWRIIDGIRRRNGRQRDRYPRQEFEQRMLRLDENPADRQDAGTAHTLAGFVDPGLGEVAVHDLLERLPSREKEVLRRVVLDGETVTEVAREWGVDRTRVAQVREHALDRLRGAPGAYQKPLSPRELEVLTLLAEGQSNKEIAALIGTSEETAKAHVRSVLAKLGARSRAHAVTVGFRQGLIR